MQRIAALSTSARFASDAAQRSLTQGGRLSEYLRRDVGASRSHPSFDRGSRSFGFADVMYNMFQGRTLWRAEESTAVVESQMRFWAACIDASSEAQKAGVYSVFSACDSEVPETTAAASTVYSQIATVRLAIAVFLTQLSHERSLVDCGRLQIVVLGASPANEYAHALHTMAGIHGGFGELLARSAGSCAEPDGPDGADCVGMTAAAVDFFVCGPQVPKELSGRVEKYGGHTITHQRSHFHEAAKDMKIDLCIALHPGFSVPRYESEWAPTLALLAERGACVAISAYDSTEDGMNRQALEAAVDKSNTAPLAVLRTGPSPVGSLLGKKGRGKYNYALTVAVLPGSSQAVECKVKEEDGFREAVAAVQKVRVDAGLA